ncbi:hypothetical protein D3C85_1891310 [compost metagenome]
MSELNREQHVAFLKLEVSDAYMTALKQLSDADFKTVMGAHAEMVYPDLTSKILKEKYGV